MPARQFDYLGLGLFVVGSALLLGCLYLAEGADRPYLRQPLPLLGATLLGLVMAVFGLLRLVGRRMMSDETRSRKIAENDLVVSLRIWLIAAAADGVLRDREVERIILNAKAYYDLDIDDAFVRETYEKLKSRTGAREIDEELFASAMPLSEEGVRHTLVGAISVALFDGELDVDERRVIDELATQFRLDQEAIDRLIAEVSVELGVASGA